MSLDTLLFIGKTFRDSESGWKYHRFIKPVIKDIEMYRKRKDEHGNAIEPVLYIIPVAESEDGSFELKLSERKIEDDEAKKQSLLYLNYKTSDKDSDKKYLFGDIIYAAYKTTKKGKIEDVPPSGNYRMAEGKKPGSFLRAKEDAASTAGTIIGKFREAFEKRLDEIEQLLLSAPAVIIHFAFPNGKAWWQLEGVEDVLKQQMLSSFVVEREVKGEIVLALNKTLLKTLKPPIWDKSTNNFKDPEGIGGVTPGFANHNTHKLRAFSSKDDVWNLMFAIDFAESPLIRVKDIGIVVLPKGDHLAANQLLDFFQKSKGTESESDQEERIDESNQADSDYDSLFEPVVNNSFADEVTFDMVFLKPKQGSSPAVDMLELQSIKKSHLRTVQEKIANIKRELEEKLKKEVLKADFRFDLKDNFLNILTTKTKAEKKYQFHLLKVLPQIYLDAYYEDPVLLPAFVERVEWSIRNDPKFFYPSFRYNLLFLSYIQKNNPYMHISQSSSYHIGRQLGIMARPFAAWRDDCPIKSFEKNYVGNLTRRIAYPEDLIKFSNFLNEKLAIHERLYQDQQEASRAIATLLKEIGNSKYNKNECALGFFESYFERRSSQRDNTPSQQQSTEKQPQS